MDDSDPRARERALRDAAHSAEGELIEPRSGREIEPRSIKQMISVRVEPTLIRALREIAERRGVSTSDLLRDALERLVAAESIQTVCAVGSWRFESRYAPGSHADVWLRLRSFADEAGVELWSGTGRPTYTRAQIDEIEQHAAAR